MNNKKTIISYFLNWGLLGLFLSLIFLLLQGYIQLSFPDKNPQTQKQALKTGFSQAVVRAAPSVVSIQVARLKKSTELNANEKILEKFLGPKSPHTPQFKTSISSGSGVILDARGYIATNYHVIKEAESIQVSLNDGRKTIAHLIGDDPETDLAILKIDLNNLPQAHIADISQLNIGDIALAIGYPFRIGQTVTQGIISATGRTEVSANTYENFLQTDAAINPGNSGGALINDKGELVGINSLIFTETGSFNGIGFAIPIDLAIGVLSQIVKYGYVVRGWLGVGGQALTPPIINKLGLKKITGILVTEVDALGPGDKAGLKPGDIITHMNGQIIESAQDILNIVANGLPGDTIEVTGLRQRQSFKIQAVLGQRPTMTQE
ncbi:MAG: trypsin-like peptidase domain-containing protein [Gammaproteobacteria bacterium]|nr:trypsin-like peptidase domain-containing protein [Gammaproteobacteria bacterium]MCK5262058.1 trypsin-like peptidase domain-containing protein [Gammaproteobacteria bacterium]